MTDIKKKSLGELESLYQSQLEDYKRQKLVHEKEIEKCERGIAACEAKLRHVRALAGETAAPETSARLRRREKRRRRSPVRAATLQALRKRRDERLTTQQLLAAIRSDTGRKVSRQSVNVNVGLLEKDRLIRRDPAPRGSGARFVYSAV